MPRLADFLAAMMADAVQARVRADLEVLKVAEAYSSHALLKHLPVPRFRMPDITVEFSAVVTGVEGVGQAPMGGPAFAPPTEKELTEIVSRSREGAKLPLPPEQSEPLVKAMLVRSKQLFAREPRYLLHTSEVAKELAAAALAVAERNGKDVEPERERLLAFGKALGDGVRRLLLGKLTESPHVQLNVASTEVKAHDNHDSLLRLRLTLSEDGYEIVDRDEGDFRLVPE